MLNSALSLRLFGEDVTEAAAKASEKRKEHLDALVKGEEEAAPESEPMDVPEEMDKEDP